MSDSPSALTLQLLQWIFEKPRSYSEAMEAWKSHCPRLTIWEDALHDNLIVIERSSDGSEVKLTEHGMTVLGNGGNSLSR